MLVVGTNIAAKFLAEKIYNLLNKAKKPGAVKPEEVEKVKDEIENAYNKAPEEKKNAFDKQMQTIEKQVEREIAESFLKKKVKTEQLDEGFKDVLLGALMSLSFMTPAKAQKTIDTLPGNMTSSKVQALAQDFKSAKNTIDVASIAKDYSGGKEATVSIPKPSGYSPLTIEQRADWNKYIKSLGDMAGSPELDKGAPETEGMKKFKEYLESNPESSLNNFSSPENLIKSIQYEMQVMRNGNNASDLGIDAPDLEAMQDLLKIQKPLWMSVDLSKMDGNPGQDTTKGYYPFFGSAGTDYKKARGTIYKSLEYEKSKLKK